MVFEAGVLGGIPVALSTCQSPKHCYLCSVQRILKGLYAFRLKAWLQFKTHQ